MKKTDIGMRFIGLGLLLASGGILGCSSQSPSATKQAKQTEEEASESTRVEVRTSANPLNRELSSKNVKGETNLPPKLPPVSEAVSMEKGLSYAERNRVIQAYYDRFGSDERNLSTEEVALLLEFVRQPGEPAGLNPRQSNALKNDVLNLLIIRDGSEEELGALLEQIHQDLAQNGVMRDYALQHLASLKQDAAATEYAQHWNKVQATVEAPAEGNSTQDVIMASTSMLHLLDAKELGQLAAGDIARLKSAALKLARDNQAPDGARLTALQVCGRLGMQEAKGLAAKLMRDDQAGFPLRIAAIATVGDLGADKETVTYLESLTNGRNKRLRLPATKALEKLQARSGGAAGNS